MINYIHSDQFVTVSVGEPKFKNIFMGSIKKIYQVFGKKDNLLMFYNNNWFKVKINFFEDKSSLIKIITENKRILVASPNQNICIPGEDYNNPDTTIIQDLKPGDRISIERYKCEKIDSVDTGRDIVKYVEEIDNDESGIQKVDLVFTVSNIEGTHVPYALQNGMILLTE